MTTRTISYFRSFIIKKRLSFSNFNSIICTTFLLIFHTKSTSSKHLFEIVAAEDIVLFYL